MCSCVVCVGHHLTLPPSPSHSTHFPHSLTLPLPSISTLSPSPSQLILTFHSTHPLTLSLNSPSHLLTHTHPLTLTLSLNSPSHSHSLSHLLTQLTLSPSHPPLTHPLTLTLTLSLNSPSHSTHPINGTQNFVANLQGALDGSHMEYITSPHLHITHSNLCVLQHINGVSKLSEEVWSEEVWSEEVWPCS